MLPVVLDDQVVQEIMSADAVVTATTEAIARRSSVVVFIWLVFDLGWFACDCRFEKRGGGPQG